MTAHGTDHGVVNIGGASAARAMVARVNADGNAGNIALYEHAAELVMAADAALAFATLLSIKAGGQPVTELLPGTPGDTERCPLAMSASATVPNGRRFNIGPRAVLLGPMGGTVRGGINVETPALAQEFMAAFDTGAYPELVEGASA